MAVQFEPLLAFRTFDAGPLWDLFRERYPHAREKAPLPSSFQVFGGQSPESVPIELEGARTSSSQIRYWFLTEDDTELIQFQSDRFVHNWRSRGDVPYPRYESIRARFEQELSQLAGFLRDRKLGSMLPNQCELSYVNHISLVGATAPHAELSRVLNHWRWPSVGLEEEAASFAAHYLIRNDSNVAVARLSVEAEPVYGADGSANLSLALSYRGRPSEPTTMSALEFLDRARGTIVRVFDAVTTEEMHHVWGKRQ